VDEKQRFRDKHRKKHLKSKGDKDEPGEGGRVAPLATTKTETMEMMTIL
jgi:hypothetical protein